MSELSDLTIAVIKFAFLALLWVFVFTAVAVMRRDLFGRGTAPAAAPVRPGAPAAGGRLSRSAGSAASSLVVTAGSMAGTTLRLGDEPLTLGRGPDCTLVLSDDYASTRHARFYNRGGQWFVEDLESTNGTYVDRMRIAGPTPVGPGNAVRIGNTTFELRK